MKMKTLRIFILCTIFFCLGICSTTTFLACKSSKTNSSEQAIEFTDLLKKIAIPSSADYNCHGERFLADSNTFVSWETDGVDEFHGHPVTSGLGGLGREGTIFIHFDEASMTKVLHKTVTETPWNISWSGTFHLIYAVYLEANVSVQDYINIVEYIQMKKMGKVINNNDSTWMEILIPGYKKLWMNVNEDFGNSQGIIRLAFVFDTAN